MSIVLVIVGWIVLAFVIGVLVGRSISSVQGERNE